MNSNSMSNGVGVATGEPCSPSSLGGYSQHTNSTSLASSSRRPTSTMDTIDNSGTHWRFSSADTSHLSASAEYHQPHSCQATSTVPSASHLISSPSSSSAFQPQQQSHVDDSPPSLHTS